MTSKSLPILLFVFLLSSCGKNPLDEKENHLHAPIFNGMIRSTPDHKHIELYLGRDGLAEIYLYTNAGNPIENTNTAKGYLEAKLQDGKKRFTLKYEAPDHHDQLSTQLPKNFPNPIEILAHVEVGKELYEAKFLYNLDEHPDKVPHMHDPRQGGQVAMIGEQHVEIVWVSPGEYRVYLSDMMRGPLPPNLAKDPSLIVDPDLDTPETLELTIDPTQTFLQASGAKNAKSPLPVTVKLTLGAKPGAIDFLLPSQK
jgi:hypothetical protein